MKLKYTIFDVIGWNTFSDVHYKKCLSVFQTIMCIIYKPEKNYLMLLFVLVNWAGCIKQIYYIWRYNCCMDKKEVSKHSHLIRISFNI